MQVTVKLEGAAELREAFRRLNNSIARDAIREAALAGGRVIQEAAKARVPVRTHRLQLSIRTKVVKRGKDFCEVAIGPSKRGFYGRFLEIGTSKMPARPWLRPAFDAATDDAIRAAQNKLWERILGVLYGGI